jgi:hypothetical protein
MNLMDIASGGNRGNYQTYVWGLDDACYAWARLEEKLNLSFSRFRGPPARGGVAVLRFRHRAIVNTYGETALDVQLSELGRFQLGVDRIKVRTVSNWTEFGTAPPHLASVERPHYFLAPTAGCLRRAVYGHVEAFYTPPQARGELYYHPLLESLILASEGRFMPTVSRCRVRLTESRLGLSRA